MSFNGSASELGNMSTTLTTIHGSLTFIVTSTDGGYTLFQANSVTGAVTSSLFPAVTSRLLGSKIAQVLAKSSGLSAAAVFPTVAKLMVSLTQLEDPNFTVTSTMVGTTCTIALSGLQASSTVAIAIPHTVSSPFSSADLIGRPDLSGVLNVKQSPFNAKGDGTTDDTTAIQAAITAATAGGHALYFPPGTYLFLPPLTIADVQGLNVFASARGGTTLKCGAGTSGIPIFKVVNSQRVSIEKFVIIGNANPANRPSAFIESVSDTTYARPYVPTAMSLKELVLGDGTTDAATYGVKYSNTGVGSDTNNSEGFFEDVLIQGVTEAGWSFEHAQSKAHIILHGGVVGSKCAVATNRGGGGAQGGSFSWIEAAASNNSEVCFDLGNSNDPIYIQRLTSEGSARLLQTGGPAGGTFGVTFQSCRFATNALHADNKAIKYKWRGPLNLIGNIFDAGGNPALIELTFNTDGTANIIGNAWNSPNSNAQSPIVIGSASGHINMQGNGFSDGSGALVIQNQSGTVSVVDAASTGTVTFNVPEFDTNYKLTVVPVTITGGATAGASRIRSISKATGGFTVTVETAPGAGTSVDFDWTISRT